MLGFLDMDGVLNSREHFFFRKTPDGVARKKRLVDKYDRITALELIQLDESKVALLQEFAIETHCKFVISSTWREGSSAEHFEELFKLCGYEFPKGSIIGCTPILDHIEDQKRGHEINQWIKDNQFTSNYFILDDDCPTLFLEDQPLVNTDHTVGLTAHDLIKAKQLVQNEPILVIGTTKD